MMEKEKSVLKATVPLTMDAAIAAISNPATLVSKPGIERIHELLERLGNPEQRYAIVHVVGTNGKGSTATMLHNILTCAGYRTGMMVSPLIESVYDYYRYCGMLISEEIFVQATSLVICEAERMADAPSEFELAVAVGLQAFSMLGCEIVVLEAGMGGAQDATHVKKKGDLTVVTHIALDHTQWLGNSVEAILREKMGMAYFEDPVLLAENEPEVLRLARQIAAEPERCYALMTSASVLADSKDISGQLEGLTASFAGTYQLQNAHTALAAALYLRRHGYSISVEAMRAGLAKPLLPFRFQIVATNPYLILDGGHNPDGVKALCQGLQQPFAIVTGVMADKEYETMYAMLDSFAVKYLATTPANARALPAAKLAAHLKQFGKPVEIAEDYAQAAEWIAARRAQGVPVLAVGTLYMMHALAKALGVSVLPDKQK